MTCARLASSALTTVLVVIALGACASGPSASQGPSAVTAAGDMAMRPIEPSADYPLSTCVVSGEPFRRTPLAYDVGGQEVQFCCGECVGEFKKSPQTYLAKVRAAAAAK